MLGLCFDATEKEEDLSADVVTTTERLIESGAAVREGSAIVPPPPDKPEEARRAQELAYIRLRDRYTEAFNAARRQREQSTRKVE